MKRMIGLVLLVLLCAVAAVPAFAQTVTAPPSPSVTPTASADFSRSDNPNPTEATAEDAVAFVRFVHTSVDAPAVDLYIGEIGDTPLVKNIAFGEVTDFILLPEGNYTVTAVESGSGVEGEALATLNWDLARNTSWFISMAGLVSNISIQIEPISLLRNDLADDIARVRVVNFVSGTEAVTLASDAGDDFSQGLGWLGVFDGDFMPGTYNLNLTTLDGSALIENATIDLPGGQLTTLLILGSAEGTIEVVPFHSLADVARVQIVNNSGEAIDIFLRPGNEQVVTSLEAGATSEWISIPSGSVTFVAYAPGTGPTGQELAAWIGELSPARDVTISFGANGTTEQTDAQFTTPGDGAG
jgi:Domain of unknown function (DUF4397)